MPSDEVMEVVVDSLSTLNIGDYQDAYSELTDIYNIIKTPIIFITSRFFAKEITKEVLSQNLKIPFKLIFSDEIPKYKFIQNLNLRFFVDDRFKNINECAPFVDIMFCIKQPWNQGREFEYNNIEVINNLGEIKRWLK